jgi:hypothetical protein
MLLQTAHTCRLRYGSAIRSKDLCQWPLLGEQVDGLERGVRLLVFPYAFHVLLSDTHSYA